MLQNYFQLATEMEIRKQLGDGFATAVMELEPGIWHGPILSGFGVHPVYVFAWLPAPTPILADIRPVVLEAWQVAQSADFNEKFYEALKGRYDIIIDDSGLPPGSVLQIGQDNQDEPVAEEGDS